MLAQRFCIGDRAALKAPPIIRNVDSCVTLRKLGRACASLDAYSTGGDRRDHSKERVLYRPMDASSALIYPAGRIYVRPAFPRI